jgi:hypothetical protein
LDGLHGRPVEGLVSGAFMRDWVCNIKVCSGIVNRQRWWGSGTEAKPKASWWDISYIECVIMRRVAALDIAKIPFEG